VTLSRPAVKALGQQALTYARAGLEVFPLHQDKTPATEHGMLEAATAEHLVARWWKEHPLALIGHRVAVGQVLLDIDPRHGGKDTWALLKETFGELPVTRRHRSGRNDGGGHIWFRRPEGKLSVKPLNDWAEEHGVGHEVGKQSWSGGIDLLHHDHRYTILPESPHPDTGEPYLWTPGAGLEVATAVMPAWLAGLVTVPPAQPSPPRPPLSLREIDSIADWFSATHSWHDLLQPEAWALVKGDGDGDGSSWRHPNATSPMSATIRHGCLFVYSNNTDFEVTEHGDPHGYTRFRAYAVLSHHGDLSDAARAARELKDGAKTTTLTGAQRTPGPVTVVEPDPEPDPEPPGWPDPDPEMRHGILGRITAALEPHTEADPAGVLACLLGYSAASIGRGPHIVISGGRHYPQLYLLLAGQSSIARKGSADQAARQIMRHADPDLCAGRRMSGLNSGEALIDAVRDPRWGHDKQGNDVLLDPGVDDKRLLLVEPEFAGRLLAAGKRAGSTISALLRQAWDDGDLQNMARNNPARATGAHLCLIGHTTVDELLGQMTDADITAGLMNRIMIVAVRASRRLPFGGSISPEEVAALGNALRGRLEGARRRQTLTFGPDAHEAWPAAYDALLDDQPPGPLGALTARGPTHVLRVALIHTLLDGAEHIGVDQLRAAVAFWAYCRGSAEKIVGQTLPGSLTGSRDGDVMLDLLITTGVGWTARSLKEELGWNGSRVSAARGRLLKLGLAWTTEEKSGGRPRLVVVAVP
jgi:hypothetical protein